MSLRASEKLQEDTEQDCHKDLSLIKVLSDLWGMEFNYAGSKHLSFCRRENSFNDCNIFWSASAFKSCLRERSLNIHGLSRQESHKHVVSVDTCCKQGSTCDLVSLRKKHSIKHTKICVGSVVIISHFLKKIYWKISRDVDANRCQKNKLTILRSATWTKFISLPLWS